MINSVSGEYTACIIIFLISGVRKEEYNMYSFIHDHWCEGEYTAGVVIFLISGVRGIIQHV